MNNREFPLYWSFPCGNWFQTRVRVSLLFPIAIAVFCVRLESLLLGLVFSAVLFVSVLFHEFGHILAARLTGGSGNEILIWPLGGLAYVQPARTFRSQMLTPAAGPLVNLVMCAMTSMAVLQSDHAAEAFHPLKFPQVALNSQIFSDLLVLMFEANWVLLLLNLIPVYPLDGGKMLQVGLATRLDGDTATELYIRIGFFVAIIGLVAGLLVDNTMVMFIATMVLVFNIQESLQLRAGENYDESFMGYDFSQGYTSLEKSGAAPKVERRPGLIERWRNKRKAEKERREQESRVQAEQQLDELLQKVHNHGMHSLSDAERRLLDRVSARFRDKGKEPQEGA